MKLAKETNITAAKSHDYHADISLTKKEREDLDYLRRTSEQWFTIALPEIRKYINKITSAASSYNVRISFSKVASTLDGYVDKCGIIVYDRNFRADTTLRMTVTQDGEIIVSSDDNLDNSFPFSFLVYEVDEHNVQKFLGPPLKKAIDHIIKSAK